MLRLRELKAPKRGEAINDMGRDMKSDILIGGLVG